MTSAYFHIVVESCQTLNEHVSAFVGELVAPSNEEVEGFVQIKVIMAAQNTEQNQSEFAKWINQVRNWNNTPDK